LTDYFRLSQEVVLDIDRAIRATKEAVIYANPGVIGFNIGWNAGSAVGQTVFHAHAHPIPRRYGDVADAQGGIRRVVPAAGRFLREDVDPTIPGSDDDDLRLLRFVQHEMAVSAPYQPTITGVLAQAGDGSPSSDSQQDSFSRTTSPCLVPSESSCAGRTQH
jgi:hypothetical protein